MSFKPTAPFNVKFRLIQIEVEDNNTGKPTEKEIITDDYILASFKTYGGTDLTVNGRLVVEDTGTLYTYYNPKIGTRTKLLDITEGVKYEVLGRPENIERRNQYMMIRVRSI